MQTTAYEFGMMLTKQARLTPVEVIRAARRAARAVAESRFAGDTARKAETAFTGAGPANPRTASAVGSTPLLTGPTNAMHWTTPVGVGMATGGVGGLYRGYTHDRKDPYIGGITQGLIGATTGAVLGGLTHGALRYK